MKSFTSECESGNRFPLWNNLEILNAFFFRFSARLNEGHMQKSESHMHVFMGDVVCEQPQQP